MPNGRLKHLNPINAAAVNAKTINLMFNFLSKIFGPSVTPKNPYTQIPKGDFRQTQVVTPPPDVVYTQPNIAAGNIYSGKFEYPFNNHIASGYCMFTGLID